MSLSSRDAAGPQTKEKMIFRALREKPAGFDVQEYTSLHMIITANKCVCTRSSLMRMCDYQLHIKKNNFTTRVYIVSTYVQLSFFVFLSLKKIC